jgi:hypothetical protein
MFQEHQLWSQSCGKVTSDDGEWNLSKKPGQRYLDNKPTMIRHKIRFFRSSFKKGLGANLSLGAKIRLENCPQMFPDSRFSCAIGARVFELFFEPTGKIRA